MGRVFASSDWHGCGKIANKVLNWLQPDDILYFLGDAIDRAPDGIEILDRLLNRPNTFFIRGNHEDMMARAISDLLHMNYTPEVMQWFNNGGNKTWERLMNKNEFDITMHQYEIYQMLKEMLYISPAGHTVILEHAGYTPNTFEYRHGHDPLWDRSHFHDDWSKNEENANIYLVHGHTPVQYLKFEYSYKGMEPITKEERLHKHDWWKAKENTNPKVIRYCKGHKFDIDLCTVVSKKAVLLDLDTFEEIYFEEED